MTAALLTWTELVGLPLAVAAPAAALARTGVRRTHPHGGRALAAAAAVYAAYAVVVHLPRVGELARLQFNWQGKLLAAAAALALVALWPALSRREVGLVRPIPGAARTVVVTGLVLLGAALLVGKATATGTAPSREEIAFQLLVPGLDEELVFRGILLALLTRAVPVDRAVLLSALLFGLGHGLTVGGDGLQVDPAGFVATALLGLVLGRLRVRTGSLLPGIVLHNLYNTTAVLAAAVL